MKLSIITVNLNNRDGLQKTIDSVVSQTFRDFEWIVIDGGSIDGSKELIEHYADQITYWVSEPDNGIYNAMNKGIIHAHGDYLLFLNSGDWLHDKEVLARVIPDLRDDDILYGDVEYYKDSEKTGEHHYSDNISFYHLFDMSLAHCSTFIKRELFNENNYDESLKIAADWKFFIQMALSNKKTRHINTVVSCFDLSGISTTSTELLIQERLLIEKEMIPKSILADCKMIERWMEDKELMQIVSFWSKNTTFKFLTSCLSKFFNTLRKVNKSIK